MNVENLRFIPKQRHERSVKADCGQVWIDGDFWFCVLAAAGLAGAFLLNQAITMAGKKRRRRKRSQSTTQNALSHHLIGTLQFNICQLCYGNIAK